MASGFCPAVQVDKKYKPGELVMLPLPAPVPVCGDIKVEFFHAHRFMKVQCPCVPVWTTYRIFSGPRHQYT